MNKITLLGISVILIYSIIQILQFYGVPPETYLTYIYFYLLLIISIFILPNNYPQI